MTTTKSRSQSGSKRRILTSTVVPKAIVEQAHLSLAELAKKPKENALLRDAVEQTLDAIATILDKGYSPDEVAELMRKNGFSLNLSKLRQGGAASAKGNSRNGKTSKASPQSRSSAKAPSSRRKK
jgi:hypothetical protein